MNTLAKLQPKEVIAIGGKTIRGIKTSGKKTPKKEINKATELMKKYFKFKKK